jgi:hypothetical protein
MALEMLAALKAGYRTLQSSLVHGYRNPALAPSHQTDT